MEGDAQQHEPLSGQTEWGIVVFAKNEQDRIGDCLKAVAVAAKGRAVQLVLLINGSTDGTLDVALDLLPSLGIPASVFTIPYSCKSHAMNLFIRELRPEAKFYFFVDATVFVEPDAFNAMAQTLEDRPGIMAVSGLPINGRSAPKMRRDAEKCAQLFGQMFAVRNECLGEMVSRGRRLPIGLYRGDGLFCGFICSETDVLTDETWIQRIATVPTAEWKIRPISIFGWKDMRTGFNRLVRQARGRLENQSWNSILWTKGLSALPRFADEMILDWLKTNRPMKEPPVRRFFTWLALRRISRWKRPPEADLMPQRKY